MGLEMGLAYFTGLLVNRHAQLGSFDLVSTTTRVRQAGYKLMMNSQCAGLTTRFAIARMFPDADLCSSWDSTFFQQEPGGGEVTASEGLDCFVAILTGMSHKETHAQLEAALRVPVERLLQPTRAARGRADGQARRGPRPPAVGVPLREDR
jgi:hypothetical protein